jgi:hypothetical protein
MTAELGTDPLDARLTVSDIKTLQFTRTAMGLDAFLNRLHTMRDALRREDEARERDRLDREKHFRRFVAAETPNLAPDLFDLSGLDDDTVKRLTYLRQHGHPMEYAAKLGEARIAAAEQHDKEGE